MLSGTISHCRDAGLACAIRATVNCAARFHSMSYHATLAVRAPWRQGLNRTFKAVEHMLSAAAGDCETLVVFVPTNFTTCYSLNLLTKLTFDERLGRMLSF